MRYEEAAQQVTATGWACKKCGRFWGADGRAEHMARWCCATDLPCPCGGRITAKSWAACEACRERSRLERWEKKPLVDWDGEAVLCEHDGHRFFFSRDDVAEWLLDWLEDGGAPEDVRLEVARPHQPKRWDLKDAFDDYLSDEDDHGPPAGWEAAERAVNDWLKGCGPWSYIGGGPAVTPSSLREAFPELPWPEHTNEGETR